MSRRARKSISGLPDMENATVDLGSSTLADNRKKAKSRSKSIGPGGLEGPLKAGSGNRRVSLAAPSRPPPRSILKPTIPILPEIPPHKPRPARASGTENLMNVFSTDSSGSSGTKVALRTEEEQQAAAREREERERAEMEKEINDRREARRKSLANRRVSFAAEATLHTFHEIEFMQDSTTSTDSTRRASSLAAQSPAPPEPEQAGSDVSEALSTRPEQIEEIVPESSEDQRQLHQKKHRRSSAAHSMLDLHDADHTIASTVYDSDSDHGDSDAEVQEEASDPDSDSDSDNDGTMVTVDAEEMTSVSLASNRQGSDVDTTSSIDDALRLASQRAHDIEREPADDEEVIAGFAGWGKKPKNLLTIAANDHENILPQSSAESSPLKSSPMKDADDGTAMDMEMDMEMTRAVGGIIKQIPASPEQGGSEDMSMDVTRAFGGILSQSSARPPINPIHAVEEESMIGDDSMDLTMPLGAIQARNEPADDDEDENEDMSMEFTTILGGVLSTKNKFAGRRSLRQHQSPTKAQEDDQDIPMDVTMDMTVAAGRILPADTDGDVGGDADVTMGIDITTTGSTTPRVVLTPQRPRLSGVGIDRTGLGSPRVSEIFDRRGSIGDTASDFKLGQAQEKCKAVAFQDPKAMEEEIDRERQDAEDRESGRRILEREADGAQEDRDATLNLKEMIQGLSPKKTVFRGRKSLHVGSARGLLGKRPAELDDDDEDAEENDGYKRLKGHYGSPVKNVKLQQPPCKAETTGRMTRSTRRTLDEAAVNIITPTTTQSSEKESDNATTPNGQGRFTNVADDQPSTAVNFDVTPSVNELALQADDDGERIHLQDFLNMTSIRFMELTTTKRRHTMAPSAPKDSLSDNKEEHISFEKCVVAGACTVPMLELYQHSCRELKKYISEGRRIVREIETETLEENPPLFREYISATPEFKVLMDNQFKNVKTHARLLSKAMWYEWRMKLQEGLKEGLMKTAEGMIADEEILEKQQTLLSSVLPAMVKDFAALEREHDNLEAVASELEDCDPKELESARSDLVAVDEDMNAKIQDIAELRKQFQTLEESVGQLTDRKQHCHAEIKEAEKIREECRGWNTTEISSLKTKVDDMEKKSGWSVTGVVETTVSMTYQQEIELVFDTASFQPGSPNSPIDLWYIAGNREYNPIPLTTEKDFFLQCTRDYVRSLPQSQTKLGLILGVVRAAWDRASAVANHVCLLNVTFPSKVVKTSDSSIAIKSSLLLVPLKTKVEVVMSLHSATVADGVEFSIAPHATVVYGEQFNAPKMTEFLSMRIGSRVYSESEKDVESWSSIVMELRARLLARGRK